MNGKAKRISSPSTPNFISSITASPKICPFASSSKLWASRAIRRLCRQVVSPASGCLRLNHWICLGGRRLANFAFLSVCLSVRLSTFSSPFRTTFLVDFHIINMLFLLLDDRDRGPGDDCLRSLFGRMPKSSSFHSNASVEIHRQQDQTPASVGWRRRYEKRILMRIVGESGSKNPP